MKKISVSTILQHFKDIAVIVFIIRLIYTRCKVEEVTWIAHVTYIGLLIAMYDLLVECLLKFYRKKGFGLFLLICLFLLISCTLTATDIFTGVRVMDARAIDIYTLITLVISLPRNIYISLIGLILKKDRG